MCETVDKVILDRKFEDFQNTRIARFGVYVRENLNAFFVREKTHNH